MKFILSRAFWTFVVLADMTAIAGLLELLFPKEHQVAFVWSSPYNWLPILLCLAVISIAIALTNRYWTHARRSAAK